jgi:hypothetical protein
MITKDHCINLKKNMARLTGFFFADFAKQTARLD